MSGCLCYCLCGRVPMQCPYTHALTPTGSLLSANIESQLRVSEQGDTVTNLL